jgi:hypothetical protein
LDELFVPYDVGDVVRERLSLGASWPRRWSAAWRFGGRDVVWPVRDLAAAPVSTAQPVRRFTWRAAQRHRPGLQFMASTGRLHGFESLEEARLLPALDFVRVAEVLSQPFRLVFEHGGGRAAHIPDFLAVMPSGARWLFDVRPRRLIGEADALAFAATEEAAAACGWRYLVVCEWRPHVWAVLDHLSARRRPLDDPLGLRDQLEASVDGGGFGDTVASMSLPVLARAHAVHLLWHRRLGIDLGRPFGDASRVWRAGPQEGR